MTRDRGARDRGTHDHAADDRATGRPPTDRPPADRPPADGPAPGVRVTRYGPHALLVDLPDLGAVQAADRAVRAASLLGVVEVVPAARTVLVRFVAPEQVDEAAVRTALRTVAESADGGSAGAEHAAAVLPDPLVVLPVRYDGPDLAEVARRTGLSETEVVDLHRGGEYRVAFGGFMPGFGYLTGLDARLHLPRLSTPRARVPAGSVAVAGEFAAVYPGPSPGGWWLLGTCDRTLFDPDRDPPALVTPGTRVRFEAVRP